MEESNELFQEITEGNTKLLVPKKSLTEKTPPIKPAFFNPKARTNRDFSIIAYAAFLKKFEGPKIFLEGLSGVGARGLRVANELKVEKMIINDLNPTALQMAKHSANLNNLKNIEFSEKEACVFLSEHSRREKEAHWWILIHLVRLLLFLIVELGQPCTVECYLQQQQIFRF